MVVVSNVLLFILFKIVFIIILSDGEGDVLVLGLEGVEFFWFGGMVVFWGFKNICFNVLFD